MYLVNYMLHVYIVSLNMKQTSEILEHQCRVDFGRVTAWKTTAFPLQRLYKNVAPQHNNYTYYLSTFGALMIQYHDTNFGSS